MAMTDAQVDELLSAPMVSVIATVNAAGMPAQSPVWHLWRGGAAFVLVSRTSRKWRNLQRNPNVSLCVDTKTAPYRAAIVAGDQRLLVVLHAIDEVRHLPVEAVVPFLLVDGERPAGRGAGLLDGVAVAFLAESLDRVALQ